MFFLPTVSPGADSLIWEIDSRPVKGWSPTARFADPGSKAVSVTAWLNGKSRIATTSVNITDFDLSITLPSDTTACRSEFPPPRGTSSPVQFSVTAKAQGASSFIWSNGDTGATLKPAKAGYYWVVVSASNGCSAAAGVNVKEYGTADQRTNLWYFGNKAGIDFNVVPNKALDVSAMNAPEGCAMVGDRNSNALFYTDGDRIYDRKNTLITSGLGGSPGATQSATILPLPGDETIYYIFSSEATDLNSTNTLYYSIFDLKLNGGFGGMVEVKRPLFSRTTERSTGTSSWLLTHEYGNNAFRNYSMTQDGLGNPVISVSGADHSYAVPENAEGYMRIGPRNLLVVPLSTPGTSNVIEVFDLEASTGKVSNPRTVDLEEPAGKVYGVEFASGGDKLFVTVSGIPSTLVEFWLDNNNTLTRIQKKSFSGRLGAIQLAPNGQVYIAAENASSLVSILVNAAKEQPSAIDTNGFPLAPGTTSRLGLPNFILPTGNSFGGPALSYDGICLGGDTELTGVRTDLIDVMTWTVQDIGTFPETLGGYEYEQFKVRFPQAKTYNITLSMINRCITQPIVISDKITIKSPPSRPAVNGPALCSGPVTVDAGSGGVASVSYLWGTGETTRQISTDVAGSYVVTLIDNTTGCISNAAVNVTDGRPAFDFGPDRSLCEGAFAAALNSRNPGAIHSWKVNGIAQSSTSQFFPIDTRVPGVKTYTASVKNLPTSPAPGCERTEDITITIIPKPVVNFTQSNKDNDCATNSGEIKIEIVSPRNSFSYFVTGQSFNASEIQNPIGTYTLNNLATGAYSVLVYDEVSGCRNTKTLTVSDITGFTIDAVGGVTCSQFAIPVTITTPGNVPGNYEVETIDDNGVKSAVNSCNPCTAINTVPLSVGNYAVQVKNKVTGCKVLKADVKVDPGSPVPAVISANSCGPLPVVTASTTGTVTWTGPGTIANPTQPTTSVDPGGVGTFDYKAVVKRVGFCDNEQTVSVIAEGPRPTLSASDKCKEEVILSAGGSGGIQYLYQWSRNGIPDPSALGNSITIGTADNGSSFSAQWISVNSGCTGTAGPIPGVVIGKVEAALTSTPACQDNQLVTLSTTLNAGPAATYQWSFRDPAATNPAFAVIPAKAGDTIKIRPEGIYRVEVDRSGCKDEKDIRIQRAPLPQGKLPNNVVICADEQNNDPNTNQFLLDPGNFFEYQWFKNEIPQTGATTRTFIADTQGTYRVRITSSALCVNSDETIVADDCIPRIVAPTAFRPESALPDNRDFSLFSLFITGNFQVFIYNRWGELIYQSNDKDFKWNGCYNNQLSRPLPGGTYAWVARYESSYDVGGAIQERRGGVLLIR
ncbi:MAG: gliding motility-associated C-terminal domain-containing protein [Bacteroidota bacterium]